MNTANCNCIICATEFDPNELQSIALSKINITNFKICQSCLDNSNPDNDYSQVRDVVNSYLKYAEAKHLFAEVKDILNSINIELK